MDRLLMIVAITVFIVRLLFLFSLGDKLVQPLRDQKIYLSLATALYEGKGLICPPSATMDSQPQAVGLREKVLRNVFSKTHFRNVAKYGKPTSFWMPVYPIFLSFLWGIMGQELFAMRLAQIMIDTGTAMIITLLAARLFNMTVGAVSGFIFAFYPYFVYYSVSFMTESLFTLLLAASLYFYFAFQEDASPHMALGCGVMSGLCFLTRSSVFYLFPILFLLLLLRRKYLLRYYAYFAIIPAAFILTILPWGLRNRAVHGDFFIFPTKAGVTLWARNNPLFLQDQTAEPLFSHERLLRMKKKYLLDFPSFRSGKEIDRNRVFYDRTLEFIRSNPAVYAKLCWLKTKWFFSLTGTRPRPVYYHIITWLSAGIVLPLGFIGAITALRRHKGSWTLFIVMLYTILIHILLNGDTRFRHPIEPYFIIFASFLIAGAASRLQKRYFPDANLDRIAAGIGLGPSEEEKKKAVYYDPGVPVTVSENNRKEGKKGIQHPEESTGGP